MTTYDALNSEYFKKYDFLYLKILNKNENIINKEYILLELLSFLLDTFKPTNWLGDTPMNAFDWLIKYRKNEDQYLCIIKMGNNFGMTYQEESNLTFKNGIILENLNINEIKNLIKHGSIRPNYKPKKNIRLLENNLHDNYPYDSFVIKFNTVNELDEITDILNVEYNVYLSSYLYTLCVNYLEMNENKKSLFLRLYFIEDKLTYEINHFDKLDEYSKDYGWNYDRIYTLNDFRDGVLSRILKTGKSIPTYKPKEKSKRILESYITDRDLTTEQQLKLFKIGDDVIVKKNAYDYFNDVNDYMNDFLGGKYKILDMTTLWDAYEDESKFYITDFNESKYDDLLLTVGDKNDKNNSWMWYYKCLIPTRKLDPVYEPKRNIRLLEKFNNLSNKYDYNCLIIKIDTIKEIEDLEKYLSNYNIFIHDISTIKRHLYNGHNCYIRIYINQRNNRLVATGNIMKYLDEYSSEFDFKYEKIYDVESFIKFNILGNIIRFGIYIPDYEPKGSSKRLLERKNIHKDYPFKTIIVEIKNEHELSYMIEYLKNEFDSYMTDYHEKELKKYLLNGDSVYIRFNYRYNSIDISHSNMYSLEYNIKRKKLNYYKLYTVKDVKNGIIENILNSGKEEPLSIKLYKPKGKIIRENMITKLKDYLLLEKSSLSALGVPREVMQPIQKDLAIPADAKWDRIKLKRDAVDILNNNDKVLLLQIDIDMISVFISFNNKYFIDTYVMKDSKDWGGGYNKLPREKVSKTQFISRLDSSVLLYHLIDNFSIKTQPYRKMDKKEKNFLEFTENFKKDFLQQFNSILKRIVGYNYKDAKDDIADKAKRVEIENKMMISGLENPLEGPNSLTILDQFLIEFEDEYSKYFDERLDIMELSELFTRDKIMTSFMLFIYSGKIITT